jgi:hypothetical protein
MSSDGERKLVSVLMGRETLDFRERSVNFREHSVNFREHSVNFRSKRVLRGRNNELHIVVAVAAVSVVLMWRKTMLHITVATSLAEMI